MGSFLEDILKHIAASPEGKIASTDVLWNSELPGEVLFVPEPSSILYKCILTALPGRYNGLVYDKSSLPKMYSSFFEDASEAPVLRVAAIVGVLAKLAQDPQISDDIRGKIDRGKTDTLFWQMLGKEKPLDAKTESGTGWSSSSFMGSLPAQMQRILDDCHLFSNMLKWKEGFGFHTDDLGKAEKAFQELLGRIKDPFYTQDLLQKLASGKSPADLQKIIYVSFIKLGLVERTIWQRKRGRSVSTLYEAKSNDEERYAKSADYWAVETLVDPIAQTRSSVKVLCDQLYVSTQGTLDDTARSQIREIPRKLTGSMGGIDIISGINVTIVDYFVGRLIDVAERGLEGYLMPSEEQPRMSAKESQQHKEDFVKEQGQIVQCLKVEYMSRSAMSKTGQSAVPGWGSTPAMLSGNDQDRRPSLSKSTAHDTVQNIYEPLGSTEIRLIKILPGMQDDSISLDLHVVDLQQRPMYDALSYVWTPRDRTIDTARQVEPVTIGNYDNARVCIGANLEAAIRCLRSAETPRTLWVDALCINQDEKLERNHQVRLMSKIYSSARNVIIWLGPPQNHSEFALSTCSTGRLNIEDIGLFIYAMEAVLRRDWFGRLWIAQELTLSRMSPLIYHGQQILDWDSFASAVRLVHARILGQADVAGVEEPSYLPVLQKETIDEILTSGQPKVIRGMYPPAMIARAECVEQLDDMRKAGPHADFTEQLLRTKYLQASDVRDKVFGLLGMSTFKRWEIVPDYTKSYEEVVAMTAAVMMRENFGLYIRSRLWELARGKSFESSVQFAWVPDLQLLSRPRHDSLIVPSLESLQQALAQTHGIAPLVNFSKDCRSFTTIGRHRGRIVAAARVVNAYAGSTVGDSFLSGICQWLSVPGEEVDTNAILSALMGPNSTLAPGETKELLDVLNQLCQYSLANTDVPRDLIDAPAYKDLQQRLEPHDKLSTEIFVTDTGLVGIAATRTNSRSFSPLLNNGNSPIVAGLFGLDLPFILEKADGDNQYQMITIAHVAYLTLGDEFVESMRPGANLWEAVDKGGLQPRTATPAFPPLTPKTLRLHPPRPLKRDLARPRTRRHLRARRDQVFQRNRLGLLFARRFTRQLIGRRLALTANKIGQQQRVILFIKVEARCVDDDAIATHGVEPRGRRKVPVIYAAGPFEVGHA
ncbi:hypothetical protein OPT61_g5545 [Boeremia exigua]|uniref:Uncharacterized protein n=1 Tax=Boeremia exigua TaxID=749465 RepID=A0ACC2IA41_9PLEO|nr:hypothetical protein OPT61_g5545 [Boeremia exigua]